ncbi:MAG: putative transcriptional regulator protein, partial [Bacteroidetes bacterium]|nr:putative transcriptional regulator protein [Bacteroidota bacterium]
IHPSQQIESDTAEECLISINVVINKELTMLLMSYGANVKVLQPAPLAEQIAAEAKAMLERY